MKKALISLIVVLVLFAGYFVGNNFYNNSTGRTNKAEQKVGGEHDVIAARNNTYSTGRGNDCSIELCAPSETEKQIYDPAPVGNPKGTKIIKSASVSVVVGKGKIEHSYDEIIKLIPKDGYVEDTYSTINTSILTLRIPSDKLDITVKDMRKLGVVVASEMISQDRTYEISDNELQLKGLNDRLSILNNQLTTAKTFEEKNTIENQIFTINQQIASIQSQLDYVNTQVDLSTLRVSLSEKKSDLQMEEDDRPMLVKAWEKSSHSLLSGMGGIMIIISSSLPFIALGVVLFFIVRGGIRHSKEKKDKKDAKDVKENK